MAHHLRHPKPPVDLSHIDGGREVMDVANLPTRIGPQKSDPTHEHIVRQQLLTARAASGICRPQRGRKNTMLNMATDLRLIGVLASSAIRIVKLPAQQRSTTDWVEDAMYVVTTSVSSTAALRTSSTMRVFWRYTPYAHGASTGAQHSARHVSGTYLTIK